MAFEMLLGLNVVDDEAYNAYQKVRKEFYGPAVKDTAILWEPDA